MKKYLLSLLISLLSALTLSAAINYEFRFRHLSVENGLSSNGIRAIVQDKHGYIWFGTDEGLNRYDGKNIKSFKIDNLGVNEYIYTLYATQDLLWVGTGKGLYTFVYETEEVKPFLIQTANNQHIQSSIQHIVEDKQNNLWFSTFGQGAFKYDPQKQELVQYDFTEINGMVASVCIDSDNQIWVTTNWGDHSLFKLNKVKDSFEPTPLKYNHPKYNSYALAMFEDSHHNLWLGTWESGLQKIDKYTGETQVYLHPSDGIKGTMHIHTITEYMPGELLIGSDDGLLHFNTFTKEYRLHTKDDANPHSLSNNFVYPILKDHEGGIWIGTYYGGVNYISPHANQFENYTPSTYRNSVSGSVIGRFCEGPDGEIWIASDDGGLSCLLPQTKQFTHYLPNENKNSLSYHNVHALCIDEDNLWIGTYSGNLNVLNLKNNRFKQYISYSNNPNTIDGSSCYSIFKDRENKLWMGTMSGINIYNHSTDDFTRIKAVDAMIIDIDQDKEGNMWFCTQGEGVYKYISSTKSWKNYTYATTEGKLANDQCNCILIDRSGELWLGTMNGLYKYIAENDQFERIELEIPSQNICCIIEDQGILWMTTGKGLIRYIPNQYGCQVFTKSDGLQSDQFLPNAGLMTKEGKIYVGTANGFNAFYPHLIKTNQSVPPVVITNIELFNKEILVGDKRLPKSLTQTKELNLSYKDHAISLLFASLSYCTPEKNQFAYMLEGFDKEWNYVGSQNKATYTNLPPGSYTFRVKATNNDGVWNDEGTNLVIHVHPPFYWNNYSKFLYVVLFIVVLTYFFRFLLKRSEKKHSLEIKELNAIKEHEIHEAKIKFFTTIAHEIRTPVSLIIGPLEKIMRSLNTFPEAVSNDLKIIDRNSQRLLFLVNQLLDFRKVEQEGMKMKFVRQNISQMLKAVCERFEPSITHNGSRMEVEYPDENFTAMIDNEAVTKLVSNLLTNANKYTKDYVKVSCMTQPNQQTFTIIVTDNGMGISKEEQKKIFKPFYQAMDNKPGTGIGLSLVKSIVEGHNGSIEVKSEVGQGSSFIVTLPIEQPEGVPAEENSPINPSIPEDILQESLHVPTDKEKSTILIVDDNQEMLHFLSTSFSDKATILTAEDGLQALDILNENEVTLIISDWMMPNMDGIEFCKTVRANQLTSHIPFILLTAKTDTSSKIEGMDCGADAYIEKPCSVQYLDSCIRNLVEMRILLHKKFSKTPLMPLNSIANNTVDDHFLRRLNQLIEDNFSNSNLSVDFLAEQLCISRSGLFAKIKTLANVTPNELIQVVRLKKAASLLLENKYRVSEICYMIGFNNPSYFSKCFQKQFGMKPGEFAISGGNKQMEE